MSRIGLTFWVTTTLVYLCCCSAKVHGVPTTEVEDAPESTPENLTGHYELEESILKNLTKSTFNGRIRPSGTTAVKINIYIRDAQMKSGSPTKITYDLYNPWNVDLTLRQKWNDPRLAYNVGLNTDYHYFPLNSAKSIWKPDLFFPDADKGDFHYVAAPNTLVWIYPNGDVLYSLRLSLSLPCRQPAVPRRFGHGIGIPVACPLRLASYAYTSDQLVLAWEEKDPLQIADDLYTQNNVNYCTMDKASTNSTKQVQTRTGNFSVISSEILFLC